MANTKIQRWAVLIAEFGADIQYREGKNNIRVGINRDQLIEAQREAFPVEWQAVDPDTEDYGFENGVLFSTKRPGPRQA